MRWAEHAAHRGKDVHTGLWWGNLWKTDHLEDPGIDGRIMLRWIFRRWDRGIDWIDLAQKRDRWQALVNAIMNLQVPSNGRNFWTSLEPISFSRTMLHAVSE